MVKLSAALLLLGAFLAEVGEISRLFVLAESTIQTVVCPLQAFMPPAPALRRVPDTMSSVHGTRKPSFALRSNRCVRWVAYPWFYVSASMSDCPWG